MAASFKMPLDVSFNVCDKNKLFHAKLLLAAFCFTAITYLTGHYVHFL